MKFLRLLGTQFSNQNPTDKSGKKNLPESVQNQPKFVKKCPKSVQTCPKVLQKYPVQGAEPLFLKSFSMETGNG